MIDTSGITKVTKDGVDFFITEEGKLYSIINNNGLKSITIPSEFEPGVKVTSIGSFVCNGNFKEIFISDEIKDIDRRAFYNLHAESVHWSKGCKIIPERCFQESSIRKIYNIEDVECIETEAFLNTSLETITWPSSCQTIPAGCFENCISLKAILNIDHVTYVGDKAFRYTAIGTFKWPSKCKRIPAQCFAESYLEVITNIEYVEEIDEGAFESTSLKTFKWPSKCKVIPNSCFSFSTLRDISNIENISYIGEHAFSNTNLAYEVDLTKAAIFQIEDYAFQKVDKRMIKFPYYISNDVIERVFCEEGC